MLIGLILTSLIAGNLASLFMIDFVFHPILIDSNEKVSIKNIIASIIKLLKMPLSHFLFSNSKFPYAIWTVYELRQKHVESKVSLQVNNLQFAQEI